MSRWLFQPGSDWFRKIKLQGLSPEGEASKFNFSKLRGLSRWLSIVFGVFMRRALLLVRIVHKRARERGFVHGASRMLELLRGVRSAMMFYPKSSKPMRQVCHLSEDQEVLLKALSVDLSKRM